MMTPIHVGTSLKVIIELARLLLDRKTGNKHRHPCWNVPRTELCENRFWSACIV